MRFRIPCIRPLEQRSAWVSSNVEWLTNSVYKITLFSITRLIFFLRQNLKSKKSSATADAGNNDMCSNTQFGSLGFRR